MKAKVKKSPKASRPVIGWREWVALPDLGIAAVKAKVDTGAKTSSLHAFDVEVFRERGKRRVRFKVHPTQKNSSYTISAVADLHDLRIVRDSGGKETLRPVILTRVFVGSLELDIELTLASRDTMGFRMLLGRQAMRGSKAVVDPLRSFIS